MIRLPEFGVLSAGALAFALGLPAAADPFADSVDDFDIDAPLACCGDPNDALGAPDGGGSTQADFTGFVTLSNDDPDADGADFAQLDFDDNLCLLSGDDSADLLVTDYIGGATETFLAQVGLQGGLLSGSVAGSGTLNMLDFDGVATGPFNRARIESTNNVGAAPGTDLDALECLHTLDQLDIVKAHTGEETIDVGVDVEQTGFSFTIDIANNSGVDGGLAGLVFFDSVPAEFDLDPDAEDANDGTLDNGCADGACDGVDTFLADDCVVVTDTSEGAKKKGLSKLEPEHITITADALLDGDSCQIEVFVKTDNKDFVARGRPTPSPDYTPTSCAEDPGVIVLNDGVRVFDASMNLLLADDDMLTLACNNFTD